MEMRYTFLITGATRGIGLATAKQLYNLGHHVVGIARENPSANFPGHIFLCDLQDEIAADKIFQSISNQFQIDGVVNNVGIALREPFENIKLENFRKVLDLNLRTALQAIQIFSKGMIERGYGRIVNVSSRAVLGVHNASSYAAAKAGMIALTRSWALELAQTGITVNSVAPGPTETEMFRQKRPKGSDAELMSLKSIPMNRFAFPNEIAAAIAFFLSKESGFITGQTLYVDGGASVGYQLPF